ncbi:MAG: glycosyltransferase [Spirochaetaceae bacterium]|nr:glycosyltransferase [Spirochaetaceae bacterium]MCF7938741.1 glycosyltransferase [Spirochaetales bacterium]
MAIPLVSICIPTYNGEDYIEQALDSAINQTYKNIEIVISDDESSDNTLKIVNVIKNSTTIPFKIVSHNPISIGSNWNNSIKEASGEYIKFLFQDDVLQSRCIEKMVSLAERDNSIGLVFCKRSFIFKEDKYSEWINKYSHVHEYWIELKQVQPGRVLLGDPQFLQQPRNKVGEPSSVLFRKSVVDAVGDFKTSMRQALDYEWYYRVFKKYKVGFVDEYLSFFRLHDEQTTIKNKGNLNNEYLLLYFSYFRNLFWFLHPNVKIKLIKKIVSIVLNKLKTKARHIVKFESHHS